MKNCFNRRLYFIYDSGVLIVTQYDKMKIVLTKERKVVEIMCRKPGEYLIRAMIILLLAGICLCLSACDVQENPNVERVRTYAIGDVVELAGKEFFVYGTQSGKVLLLADQNIATASYSEIDQYINEYEQELINAGITVEYVGLLDYEDLDDLGGNKHSVSISGEPYLCDDAPDFVNSEESYWLGGYSKYDTYTWLYENEKIYHIQYENWEYAVRPVVHVLATEIPEG